MIGQCFYNDENFAFDIIKRPTISFENVDPLQVAGDACCQLFFASKSVQKYLDNKWHLCTNSEIFRFILL